MDWSLIERLAPSLAWPVTAILIFLIALPLLSRKLFVIAKAIADLRVMPDTLGNTLSSFQNVASQISRETQNTQSQVEVLQTKLNSTLQELMGMSAELDKALTSLQSARAALEEGRIEADTQAIKSLVGSESSPQSDGDSSLDEMHQKLIGNWKLLERELATRASAAGIEFDPKRPGAAAFALTDGRRRNHLTREQADLVTRLGRQFRKFEKLADQTEQWLTLETYSAFMSGVDQAREAVERGHAVNGVS